jgi:hypothetical protein
MENFALWALTVSAVLVALCSIVIQANADPELQRVAREAAVRRRTPVRRAGLVVTGLIFSNGVSWTLMAFGSGDWRWAALFWVPFAAGWLGRAVHAGQKSAGDDSREDTRP